MAERILIIDDNKNLRSDLRRLVEETCPGCDILDAENEIEAIRLINKTLFSVILADINLQEARGSAEGGFEVLKAANQREPDTQVIVITSFPGAEHVSRIRKLGGYGYVDRTTTYYPELLVREIRDALGLFESRQQRRRAELVLGFPEQSSGTPWAQLLPNEVGPRVSRGPLALNDNLLKGATAAIGSLGYVEEPQQRNALSQFVGQYIWNRLFRDHEALLFALGEAQNLVRHPTDLILRVQSRGDALDLPLELIHDGGEYLGLRHPLVRAVCDAKATVPPLPALLGTLREQEKPLRILLLASDTCSNELEPISVVDWEVEFVRTLIENLGPLPLGPEIDVDVLESWQSNRSQVLEKLRVGYHIVHFAGHATYDQSNPGNSQLYFWEKSCQAADEWRNLTKDLDWRSYEASDAERARVVAEIQDLRGSLQGITADELANYFARSAPSLIYLSCCHSAQVRGFQHLACSKSLGLIDAVIRTGVPTIVGNRWPLLDSESTVRFLGTFYEKLLAEYPPEQALFWARKAVDADDPSWASAVMVVSPRETDTGKLRTADTFKSSDDLSKLLEQIVKYAEQLLKADMVALYQYHEESNKFETPPTFSSGRFNKPDLMVTSVDPGDVPYRIVEMRRSYYSDHARTDPIMKGAEIVHPIDRSPRRLSFVDRERVESSAGILLRAGPEIVGVLFINYRSPHSFLEDEKLMIETFAAGAALAIQGARRFGEAMRLQGLEALQLTSRMVAHRLRNVLPVISGRIERVLSHKMVTGEGITWCHVALNNVRRAQKIVRDFEVFARKEALQRPNLLSGTELVQKLGEAVNQNLTHHDTKVEVHMDTDLPNVKVNLDRLMDDFTAFVRDSERHKPSGLQISISGQLASEADVQRVRLQSRDIYLKLIYTDNGPGIPGGFKQRIFEPFFTTEQRDGTGLGLTISKQDAEMHGGTLIECGQQGRGVRFELYLPSVGII